MPLKIKSLLIIAAYFILLPTFSIGADISLPKTGQTTCYDASGNVISCEGTSQDGEIQAGVAWPEPRFIDNGDGTITDNLTGLIWLKNANPAGTKTWDQAIEFCNNLSSGLAGLTDGSSAEDWRLPNIVELESLINADASDNVLWLSIQGFTNVQSSYYWSATTNANVTDSAYTIFMGHGCGLPSSKTISRSVWAVRNGQITAAKTWQTGQKVSYKAGDDGDLEKGVVWPSPRFTDNFDGTVTDNLTGLIWLKNANAGGSMKWTQAIGFCNNLSSGSYGLTDDSVAGNWRLPNRTELFSLVDYSQNSPSLPQNILFENVQSSYYWSSTPIAVNTLFAWHIHMGDGYVNGIYRTNAYYVWPVRGGQSGPSVNSPKEVGNLFFEKIKNCTEQLHSLISLENSYNEGTKHLIFIKASLPLPTKNPLDKLYLSFFFDLDDLMGYTPEGDDGWVTCWIDIEVGLALSLDDILKKLGKKTIPIGIGVIAVEREVNVDDPRRQGVVKFLNSNLFGMEVSSIRFEYPTNESPLGLDSFALDCGLYSKAKFSILSTTWNLTRGEINRNQLLNIIGQGLISNPTLINNTFYPLVKYLYDQLLNSNLNGIEEIKDRSVWRGFTSSDDPSFTPSGFGNQIIRVNGGIDKDNDEPFHHLDNYIPASPGEKRLLENIYPTKFYPLYVNFFSDDLQQMDFMIKARNVPEGWVIESIAEDGEPPLFNKDTYPAYNIAPWTNVKTEWHIGALHSGENIVEVQFDLECRNGILWDRIDTVSVWFKKNTIFNPGILNLLLHHKEASVQ